MLASAPDMSKPMPLYKDSNVDVYAIPICATLSSVDDGALPIDKKRKRAAEVEEWASKRLRLDQVDMEGTSEHPEVEGNLIAQAYLPDFKPSELVGLHAEEYRKLTVENMFPATTTEPPSQPVVSPKQKKSKKSQKNAEPDPVPSKSAPPRPYQSGGHPGLLTHRDRLLPKFEHHVPHPSLCYVVVGPAVRGKFDAKKADRLGVPRGPLRGKLTAGESVTFEVVDGEGGKIQKTVHAAEIMGPSDPPYVSCTI